MSCSPSKACIAVGSTENNSGVEKTLAEAWNGASWKLKATANPGGTPINVLSGVSCASANACSAVGQSDESEFSGRTLAEVWNGTNWKLQQTPNPGGASRSFFTGVSCTSTACVAVGASVNGSGTQVNLVERRTNMGWVLQTTPNVAGSVASSFMGVSCVSASDCTAVDDLTTRASRRASSQAEIWNGSAWKIQSLPNPGGKLGTSLLAVSCKSSTACTAVGNRSTGVGALTLAEVWNGSAWKVQTTPNPPDTFIGELFAVSCASADACTAVGDFTNSSGGNFMSVAETEGS